MEVSAATISTITDAVCEAVLDWQHRPLEAFYPGDLPGRDPHQIRCDHRVENRAAHLAVGVDMEGVKHVLGIWVQADEGAAFWAHVCAELANRGVRDVLIVCCDGLAGLPEAIEATWPQSMVQTCVVHLIRASMRFVSYKDRKSVAAALRPCTARPMRKPPEGRWKSCGQRPGSALPPNGCHLAARLAALHAVLGVPAHAAPRRVHHQRYRVLELPATQITKNRGHFPSEEAAVKLLWLAICNIEDKKSRPAPHRRRQTPPTNEQDTPASSKDTPPPTGNKPSPNSPPPYPDRTHPLPLTPIHRKIDRLRW